MPWEQGFLSREIGTIAAESHKRHRANIDQFLAINRRAVALQNELTVPKGPAQPLLSAVLFMRVLSHYQACYKLAIDGMVPQTRVLVRALVEAIFSLKACINSKEFAHDFLSADQINRRKFFRKAKQLKDSVSLVEIALAATPEIEAQIEADIKEAEARPITTEETSKVAGLHEWYLSVYALFSSSVHSSVRDLESHLDLADAKNPILTNEPDISETGELLDTASDAVLTAMEAVATFFKVDCGAFIADQRNALHARVKVHVGAKTAKV